MILLDTSFLVGYFQKGDVHHQKAIALRNTLRSDQDDLQIPLAIFEELMTVITNKVGSEEAVLLGKYLLSEQSPLSIIPFSEQHFSKTWQTFQKLSPHTFSFVDCLLITLSKQYQCPVLTFDKALTSVLSSH